MSRGFHGDEITPVARVNSRCYGHSVLALESFLRGTGIPVAKLNRLNLDGQPEYRFCFMGPRFFVVLYVFCVYVYVYELLSPLICLNFQRYPLRNGLEAFHWCHFVGYSQVMGGRRRTFKLYLQPFSRYLAFKMLKIRLFTSDVDPPKLGYCLQNGTSEKLLNRS
eukprot:sb/3472550/